VNDSAFHFLRIDALSSKIIDSFYAKIDASDLSRILHNSFFSIISIARQMLFCTLIQWYGIKGFSSFPKSRSRKDQLEIFKILNVSKPDGLIGKEILIKTSNFKDSELQDNRVLNHIFY
jgi:hypothetical protein